jgi:hypothetical protein
MGGPEAAQADEQFGRDGHFALFAALALEDADDETLAVDVLGFDVEGLAHTQAALVDHGEVGAVSGVAKGAQQAGDFLAGEDVRERFLAADFDLLPDIPIAPQVIAVEGAKGADRLVERAGFKFSVGLEVDEEVEDFPLAQAGKGGVRIVGGELGDPAQVGGLRAFTQSFELDKEGELPIPFE